jgi:predicted DNA-binding ribbon-helix-helix protein
MSAAVKKRSVVVGGHRTSISLEQAFWEALQQAAAQKGCTIGEMVSEIDTARAGNLSSAIRVWLLDRARQGLLPEGPVDRTGQPAGEQV